jgi:hypothetical protein
MLGRESLWDANAHALGSFGGSTGGGPGGLRDLLATLGAHPHTRRVTPRTRVYR